MSQDVTKQQAKERAAARRLVAGQSTLDKYLSPAGKAAADKQVQKQMAKASKAEKAAAESFKQCAAAGKKRAAANGAEQTKQEGLKRPRRQMVRLYPDVCSPEVEPAGSQQAEPRQHEQAEPADDSEMDFQPARKRAKKPTSGLKQRTSKNAATEANAACAKSMQDGEVVKQTASFQNFSFSKTKCITDVEVFSHHVAGSSGNALAVVSARKAAQTSNVYNGLY